MLCSICQGIRLTELVPFETSGEDEIETCQLTNTKEAYLLHPSFDALKRSGTQHECELCALIAQVLEEDQTWNDDDKIYGSSRGDSERDLVLQLRTGRSAEIYIYRVEGSGRQEDAGIFEIAVVPTFTYPEKLPAASGPGNDHQHAFYLRVLEVWAQSGERIGGLTGYAHHRHIAIDPLSGTATGIFKHWFSECYNAHAHPECSVNETGAMPTRVIDVGPADGSSQPHLHPTGAEVGQWATLSHCWGKTVTIKLTSDTFEERLRGIPMAEMPRNFRDAIVVTRILGIRYLWIDSLCIIQDSSEDWLQESAKMGEIYKNCLITIAATNAHESAAGFLSNRSAEVACHLRMDRDLTIPVYVRPKIEWYWSAEIVGPLSRRGWVLQERLLPLRILHFGGQQMMWQCRTKSLAEGFCDSDHALEEQIPGMIESSLRSTFHAKISSSLANNSVDDHDSKAETSPSSSSDSSLAALPHEKIPSSFKEPENNNNDNIYEQWYRLIGIYSKLALTKPTDKLAAVAGIAQQVQLRTGDTYLAGLWKSNIRRGLEWWSNPPSILVRPSTPQAPSWSWAALNLPSSSSSSSSNYDPSATLVGAFNLSGTAHTPLDDQEHGVQLVAFDPHLTDYGCLGNSSGSITLLGLWADVEFIVTAATAATDDVLGSEKKTRFSLSYPLPLILKGRQKQQQKQSSCTTAAAAAAAAAAAVVVVAGARARLDVAANAEDYNQTDFEIGCLQTGKFYTEGPTYPRAEFVAALLLLRRRSGTSNSKQQAGCVRQHSYCRIGLAVILENCDSDDDMFWERREVEVV